MATVHLLITGVVQGVFFRATAKEVADKLGVKGWVKNTPNDEVEAMASGTDDAIHRFINWCWQGPPKALVTDVVVTKKEETSFKDFSVIRGW
jgi:acylphosphatase